MVICEKRNTWTDLESLTVLHRLRGVIDRQSSGDQDHKGSDSSGRRLSILSVYLVLDLLKWQAL
jgi:hypothetical protein